MNFLIAVAGFLALIWLAGYVFVTLENTLLGLGFLALIGLGFLWIIRTARYGG